jgi:phosphate starvation-inducible protein PhoH and related proteins
LARKKNLTKEQREDVSTFEEFTQRKNNTYEPNKIRLNDLKIDVKCENKKQKDLKQAIEEKEVTVSTGPAGTGKTYMSLLTALHLMKTEPKYQKLVLVKSLQIINGEALGYLPGTLWEKMEPYMFSFTGNLDKIFHSAQITRGLIETGVIEIFPIAYIRGVTIDNAIVIVDEAQNLDFHSFRTIITRIGKNCKMIFLGDVDQIDRKDKRESCLARVAELFKDKEYSSSIVFNNEDSVRNPIIPKLLDLLKGEE